ncbi:hypothetical protein K7X08_021506 [Anisodus acutangulus]|uniref:Uncharacterized protein n=1 Tax=Anisodus acutangulus TaxID=402998 RepID=A0A9Q1M7G5_9SOLA|nr:hypothetical protein K7X08_021506 [Anisodus acutangulus]
MEKRSANTQFLVSDFSKGNKLGSSPLNLEFTVAQISLQKKNSTFVADLMCFSVIVTVMALPSPLTSGRLLLLLKSISEAIETSSSKRAKRKSSYNVGSLVQAEITEIRPLELRLKFGSSFHGRVHITENRSNRLVVMQGKMGKLEETREQLRSVEGEKNNTVNELNEMKQVAHEADMKASDGKSR